MSTRNSIQHFWSPTEPQGVSVGDEWYNSATNVLYKRTSNVSGAVSWLELATLDSSGNKALSNPSIKNYTETVFYTTITANAITISLSNGSFQNITTMVGANAVVLPQPSLSAGKSITLLFVYANTPTSLTFTATNGTIKWGSATVPITTLTNGKVDIYTFICDGTSWYGNQSGNF
jgi:hypothetical protein